MFLVDSSNFCDFHPMKTVNIGDEPEEIGIHGPTRNQVQASLTQQQILVSADYRNEPWLGQVRGLKSRWIIMWLNQSMIIGRENSVNL